MDALAREAVDLLHETYGRHEGHRAVHSKGTVCKGTFTPTPGAARLTRAAHLQGGPVPVITRFSNGSGNPASRDFAQDGRGMATKFYLPDGSRTDIVALNLPCFFVRTPEDFVKFTRAAKRVPVINQPGPRLALYLATHREALPAVRAFLALKPPAGYAGSTLQRAPRVPLGRRRRQRAQRPLQLAARSGRGDDLHRRGQACRPATTSGRSIVEHLGREPVRFTLQVQLAGEGDPVADPTAVWPDERETLVGRHARAHRPRDRTRHGRRRARVRPHAGHRRHRAHGRPDSALPLTGLLGFRRAAQPAFPGPAELD